MINANVKVLRSQTAIFLLQNRKNRVWNTEQQPLVPATDHFPWVLMMTINQGFNTIAIEVLTQLLQWSCFTERLLVCLCFFTTGRVIDSCRHLLTPTENRQVLEPKVAVQYSIPCFSRPKVKRKKPSGYARLHVKRVWYCS